MATQNEIVTIETVTCGACGIEFGMPSPYLKERREKGGNFYCPNGHSRVYRETECQRLEKAAKRAQDLLEQERQRRVRAEDAQREAEASAATNAKRVQRLKKRAAAGSCPCCKRNFGNLQKHMATKHPEFAKDAA